LAFFCATVECHECAYTTSSKSRSWFLTALVADVRSTSATCTFLCTVAARSRLRSADHGDLVVPRVLSRFGCRSFRVSGPTIWNDLPVDFRSTDITLNSLSVALRAGYLSVRTAEGASEKQSSLKVRLRNGFTYLLTYLPCPL